MQINNELRSVPSQVRSLLYSVVPFGSEYVCFCSQYNNSSQVYDILFRRLGSDTFSHYQVRHLSSDGSYNLSEVSDADSTYTGFEVSEPYYCYSSVPAQGIKESLPVTSDVTCFALIVIACLLILRTVFGGIKLWANRKKSVV